MAQFLSLEISQHTLNQALDIDAPKLSTNITRFKTRNEDVYAILISTWAGVVHDLGGYEAFRVLLNIIDTRGLIGAIDSCSKFANYLISNLAGHSYPLNSGFDVYESDMSLYRLVSQAEDIKDKLTILRFPKRFSPECADKLNAEATSTFLAINENCKGEPTTIAFSKGWKRKEKYVSDTNPYGWYQDAKVLRRDIKFPRWLIREVRKNVYRILNPKRDLSDNVLARAGLFSSGVTAEGCKTLAEKLFWYSESMPWYKDPLYPISDNSVDDTYAVKIVCVPKSYKTPRIIAEVSATRQFFLQAIRKAATEDIDRSKFAGLIDLERQQTNQEWAFKGSAFGLYATIDLTSASDSIAVSLARQTFPPNYFRAIERWNPKMMMVNGSLYPRFIFQTSGNGSTFVMESILFLAVALAATEYEQKYHKKKLLKPRTYGDDMLCDVRVYPTLICFLELLGFTVNADKSYGPGTSYRESCGAEYFDGIDISGKYYPRQRITPTTADGIAALCSLQHRVFNCRHAEEYLYKLVNQLYEENRVKRDWKPKYMTSSEPGTDCTDLWAFSENYVAGHAPWDRKKMPKDIPDPIVAAVARRGHCVLQSRPRYNWKSTCGGDFNRSHLELYYYVEFLQHGPSYDDPLMELLKVSSKRRDVSDDLNVQESFWAIKF